MNAFRRAWRVYADPAESDAAASLKALIPLEIVGFVLKVTWPELWGRSIGVTVVEIALLYLMLRFVRQRDEARAELKGRARQHAPIPE